MPGRGRQGKGGLRATGSPLGESGTWNLRAKWCVDRMSGLLIIGLIDWVSGDVARRLKITAHGAMVEEVAGDDWHDGDNQPAEGSRSGD